jgi:pantothenate kinase type III
MRLLIDIGNTHTTLGVWTNSKLSSVITVETKNFSKALLKIKNKPINEIFLTSVVKKSLTKLISAKIIEIKSSSKLLNVTNGYESPGKLGSDRWASIVGLFSLYKKPLYIIDCGTAISIDCVNKKGNHIGGFILSGTKGYSRSFVDANNLKKIKLSNLQSSLKFKPAKTTEKAISGGYVLMVISAIEKSYNDFSKQIGENPILVVSGGYGEFISKQLSIRNKYIPNLAVKCLGLISDRL